MIILRKNQINLGHFQAGTGPQCWAIFSHLKSPGSDTVRVRVPSAAPKSTDTRKGICAFCNVGAGLEPSNADARWASARRRLDDGGSLMSRVPSAGPGVPDPPGVWTSFMTREGLEPSNADARWASARRRLHNVPSPVSDPRRPGRPNGPWTYFFIKA